MKIAVATENGRIIAEHFGRCPFFAIYEIKESKITGKRLRQNILSPYIEQCSKIRRIDLVEYASQPDSLAEELQDCDIAISHGIDQKTWKKLDSKGIRVIVTGHRKVQKAVRVFLSHELKQQNPKITVVDGRPVTRSARKTHF